MLSCISSRGAALRRRWWPTLELALFSCAATGAPSHCINQAAARFQLTPAVLHAIVQQESSGRCTGRHPVNRNGTYDIGCAGINSAWLPELSRFGITERELMQPCTNVHVGAWILARNILRHGDTWQAVGAYNAASEPKRKAYTWKIVAHMLQQSAR